MWKIDFILSNSLNISQEFLLYSRYHARLRDTAVTNMDMVFAMDLVFGLRSVDPHRVYILMRETQKKMNAQV